MIPILYMGIMMASLGAAISLTASRIDPTIAFSHRVTNNLEIQIDQVEESYRLFLLSSRSNVGSRGLEAVHPEYGGEPKNVLDEDFVWTLIDPGFPKEPYYCFSGPASPFHSGVLSRAAKSYQSIAGTERSTFKKVFASAQCGVEDDEEVPGGSELQASAITLKVPRIKGLASTNSNRRSVDISGGKSLIRVVGGMLLGGAGEGLNSGLWDSNLSGGWSPVNISDSYTLIRNSAHGLVDTGSSLFSYGHNEAGQGARSTTFVATPELAYTQKTTPPAVEGDPPVIDYTPVPRVTSKAISRYASFFVDTRGELWMSGVIGAHSSNYFVETGIGSIKKVVAGDRHALALSTSGVLYGIGDNSQGQMGVVIDGVGISSLNEWTIIPTPISFLDIDAGGTHSAGMAFGEVYLTGNNVYGQLGVSNVSFRNGWQKASDGAPLIATDFRTHEHNTHIISSDGGLYTAGRNDMGQLGLGHKGIALGWHRVLDGVEDAAIGSGLIMVVKRGGEVVMRGSNIAQLSGYPLSDNDEFISWTETPIPTMNEFLGIAE